MTGKKSFKCHLTQEYQCHQKMMIKNILTVEEMCLKNIPFPTKSESFLPKCCGISKLQVNFQLLYT